MIPEYLLSRLEAKAIAASGRMKEWRITPMTHRANVLKLWVRRPERQHWYETGEAIGEFCTEANPETVLELIAEIRASRGEDACPCL